MARESAIWYNVKRFLTVNRSSNLKVIFLCVIGATTFWFFNALNKDYTTNLDYPIVFDYNQDSFIPVEPLPQEIQLNLSGGGWNLLRRTNIFNFEPLHIPLQNPVEQSSLSGASLRGIISDQLPDFQLNFVVTDSLKTIFQRKISRKLPVLIDSASIELQENYGIVSAISKEVDSVEIIGPELLVDALPSPYVIMVPARNIDENYMEQVTIPLMRSDLMEAVPPMITVAFEVSQFVRDTKFVLVEPVNFSPDSSNYLLDSLVTVSYMVRIDQQGQIGNDEFQVIADFDRMVYSDSSIQPLIKKYPEDIYDINIESGRLKVFYE